MGESPLKSWARALETTASITRHPTTTLPMMVDMLADKFDGAAALVSEQQTLSYRDLAEHSDYYAAWARNQNIGSGDVVCLFMPNSPNYFAMWLGITKVGGVAALINTQLVGSSLAHCIGTVNPGHIIVSTELLDRLGSVRQELAPRITTWVSGGTCRRLSRIDGKTAQRKPRVPGYCRHPSPTLADRALYIFTSGTSGLPKAASVSHLRLMYWSHWFAGLMDTQPADRMYNCLPMYHSVGGVVAIGALLVNGGSVVIRDGFSASHFWDEVVHWNCTLFQYIGELCRYLIGSPLHPQERSHRLRLCCGNGLSSYVWEEFKRRFNIPRILEFYASTEGTFSLYNCEGKPGAIGRVPSYLVHRFPMTLIKFDPEHGAPQRDDKGLCIRCEPNEIGEAISEIRSDRPRAAGQFEGYCDETASEQKLLRNVFVQGDVWYRSGDLMRRDEQGFFYFVDRVGDTFRWKGENVSTTEVAQIICVAPLVSQAVAYGVTIPGTEGRAGMVTVVVHEGFDLAVFRNYLVQHLPDYARPVFLRIATSLETTTTFKTQKMKLMDQGYDPALTTDPIYLNDQFRQEFIRVDSKLYKRICVQELRF